MWQCGHTPWQWPANSGPRLSTLPEFAIPSPVHISHPVTPKLNQYRCRIVSDDTGWSGQQRDDVNVFIDRTKHQFEHHSFRKDLFRTLIIPSEEPFLTLWWLWWQAENLSISSSELLHYCRCGPVSGPWISSLLSHQGWGGRRAPLWTSHKSSDFKKQLPDVGSWQNSNVFDVESSIIK